MAVIWVVMVMRGILTGGRAGSTVAVMFDDADLPRKKTDLLADMAREDLDRLSIAELDDRIVALESELERTRRKRTGAADFRSAADSLFRKG
jgi:uncharacterized small protein (DUF1192 family)